MKISFESTFTVLLESFVFNLNVKVNTVLERKNYVMVLIHFPLKNFERTWKRSQTQRSGNEKLRKARQAQFEKRQRVEKISQFRRIADFELIVKQLEEGCQKWMSSPLLLTDSILGLNSYPNR